MLRKQMLDPATLERELRRVTRAKKVLEKHISSITMRSWYRLDGMERALRWLLGWDRKRPTDGFCIQEPKL
jgi:hypothetical protein